MSFVEQALQYPKRFTSQNKRESGLEVTEFDIMAASHARQLLLAISQNRYTSEEARTLLSSVEEWPTPSARQQSLSFQNEDPSIHNGAQIVRVPFQEKQVSVAFDKYDRWMVPVGITIGDTKALLLRPSRDAHTHGGFFLPNQFDHTFTARFRAFGLTSGVIANPDSIISVEHEKGEEWKELQTLAIRSHVKSPFNKVFEVLEKFDKSFEAPKQIDTYWTVNPSLSVHVAFGKNKTTYIPANEKQVFPWYQFSAFTPISAE